VPAIAAIVIGIHLAQRHQLRLKFSITAGSPRLAIVRSVQSGQAIVEGTTP
jgi:hypothetical protein